MNNRGQQQTQPDDDKGSSCGNADDFRQNHLLQRAPLPHELTAEWTVNAQLKFARAGETVEKKFSTNDAINPVRVLYKWCTANDDNRTAVGSQNERETCSQDPIRRTKQSNIQKADSFVSTTSSITCGDVGGADSAFSSSNNSNKQQKDTLQAEIKNLESNFYGTRCQSTCNIIVTAVADFLSPTNVHEYQQSEPKKPFVFNTTASCFTVQPEKSACSEGRSHLNLRDAVCQTSDIDISNVGQIKRKQSSLERRDSRRSHDYKKSTTANDFLQNPNYIHDVNEDNSFMPSEVPSNTIHMSKSSSTTGVISFNRENTISNAAESGFPTDSQKKPRTVHIDVYCTGSEDDGQADAELSSDSDADDKILDQESNSTFQTVLDNEQMRLRHQRKTGSSLPRRLVDNKTPLSSNQVSNNFKNVNIGHALTKSSTVEEVQESKQLLFRKHVGDQRAVKLQNLRQKYLRQSSDDTLSFGYPNSSRSTVRDNTCSSISSALAGQDVADTSSKETVESEDPSHSLTKSDSFEYENALDRLRIRQMERLWSRSHSNENEFKSSGNSNLNIISEELSQKKSPIALTTKLDVVNETDYGSSYSSEQFPKSESVSTSYNKVNCTLQQTSHFPRNKPGFLQFFGPHLEHPHSQAVDKTFSLPLPQSGPTLLYPYYETSKSENIDNLSTSATPLLTPTDLSRQASPQPLLAHDTFISYNRNFQRSGSETPISTTAITPTPARRFDMHHHPSPALSETSLKAPPFGYSLEYLDKAKMFGKVVSARKPGHHVGPTKNPNCSCESCQRWLSERFQIRGRIFSLGEMPALKRPK